MTNNSIFHWLFIIAVISIIVIWQYFYWTNCAFVEAAKAPAICFAGR